MLSVVFIHPAGTYKTWSRLFILCGFTCHFHIVSIVNVKEGFAQLQLKSPISYNPKSHPQNCPHTTHDLKIRMSKHFAIMRFLCRYKSYAGGGQAESFTFFTQCLECDYVLLSDSEPRSICHYRCRYLFSWKLRECAPCICLEGGGSARCRLIRYHLHSIADGQNRLPGLWRLIPCSSVKIGAYSVAENTSAFWRCGSKRDHDKIQHGASRFIDQPAF